MDPKTHWEQVYRTRKPEEVSWYRPHLEVSIELIEQAAPDRDASIVDIGGGEATLVDDLLARGYRDVSVLDVSSTALAVTRDRLGGDAERVHWLCGDVTTHPLASNRYDVGLTGRYFTS